jgi:hypothetical protein
MEASINKTKEGYSLGESHRESYSTEKEYEHHPGMVEITKEYEDSIETITELLNEIEKNET